MTVRDLIAGSLRLIGAIATGETASAAEESDAISVLNDMLESWATDGFLVYAKTRESFSLVGSQQSYTMGSTGNFATTRPVRITEAGVVVGGIEMPLRVVTSEEWANVSLKSMTGIPCIVYPEGTYPLETVNVWPVPSSVYSLVIYSNKPFTPFTSANDTVSFPAGYSRSIRYNLAVDLAPEYGKPLDPSIVEIATNSKAQIMRQNTDPVYLVSDAIGLTRKKRFNILTGE